MSDVYVTQGCSDGLKSVTLIDEGVSKYFKDRRCNITVETLDGSQVSLSDAVVREIVSKYNEWEKKSP